MKTYSCYNDDGLTIMVKANSEIEADKKTVFKIAEIGLEIEEPFYEDDIEDSYVTDDETVSDWLIRNGVEFTQNSMIVMEWNDVDQSVQVYEL